MFPFCTLVQNERSAVQFCRLKPSFCMLKLSFCMLESAFPGVGRGMCKTKSNSCPGVGLDASGPEVAPHKFTHHPEFTEAYRNGIPQLRQRDGHSAALGVLCVLCGSIHYFSNSSLVRVASVRTATLLLFVSFSKAGFN